MDRVLLYELPNDLAAEVRKLVDTDSEYRAKLFGVIGEMFLSVVTDELQRADLVERIFRVQYSVELQCRTKEELERCRAQMLKDAVLDVVTYEPPDRSVEVEYVEYGDMFGDLREQFSSIADDLNRIEQEMDCLFRLDEFLESLEKAYEDGRFDEIDPEDLKEFSRMMRGYEREEKA